MTAPVLLVDMDLCSKKGAKRSGTTSVLLECGEWLADPLLPTALRTNTDAQTVCSNTHIHTQKCLGLCCHSETIVLACGKENFVALTPMGERKSKKKTEIQEDMTCVFKPCVVGANGVCWYI